MEMALDSECLMIMRALLYKIRLMYYRKYMYYRKWHLDPREDLNNAKLSN